MVLISYLIDSSFKYIHMIFKIVYWYILIILLDGFFFR
jgi:hypothetical protein